MTGQTSSPLVEVGAPRGLDALLAPRGVAVVGASPRPGSAGGRVLAHLADHHYAGGIFPVNPRYADLAGRRCYPSVTAVDGVLDLVVVCTPAHSVAAVIAECAAREVGAVVVHTDGFGGPGQPVLDEAFADRGTALRVLGPNTNGLRVYPTGMFADASSGMVVESVRPGPVAVVTESGGLGGYLAATYLRRRGLAPKYLIDTGNEYDISAAECVRYLAQDDELIAIGLILEGCRDGRSLAEAARLADAAGKRVLLLRLATNTASLAAAESHTGAVAGRFDVFRQVIADSGVVICQQPRAFADAIAMCAAAAVPAGNRLGVVTPSGGFGVLAADLGVDRGLEFPAPLAPPSADVAARLEIDHPVNPLDVSAAFTDSAQRIGAGIEFLGAQENIDGVAVWHPHGLLIPERAPELIANITAAADRIGKPVFHCGAIADGLRVELAVTSAILSYEAPDDLMAALGLLVGQPSALVTGGPQLPEPEAGGRVERAASPPAEVGASDRERLIGRAAAELLGAAGVPCVRIVAVGSAVEAAAFAREIGAPVMLKGEVPGVVHKSELGLVLGPLAEPEVAAAYQELAERCAALGGGSVTAEEVVTGVELALGAFPDVSFGPTVMVGAGGRLIELLGDVRFAPAPVTAAQAARMLTALKLYPLLQGYRGQAPADIEAAVRTIVAFSELVARPDFAYEVDVNPVIVGPRGKGAVAVDAVLLQIPTSQTRHPRRI